MKSPINFNALWRVAFLVLLLPITSAFAMQTIDSARISRLLDQAKVHAAQVNNDADALDSYARAGYSWQMHAKCLQDMKLHTTDLLADFSQLKMLRAKGTPQQRDAIDRLEPLLQSMTLDITRTIEQLNQHQLKVNMPSFRNRVHGDWESVNRVYTHLCECTNKNSKI